MVIVGKFVFPSLSGHTDIFGFICLVGMWIIINIGLIMLNVYMFYPYLLYGYYKEKYSEEYRLYEGKTQLEWYGEKYFDKYIKGTKLEEK
ncbi:hypothetical protein [Floricoccus tropicus]|uniref:hypothetical protein n=1 Tax=Floricoccus tropicus TaxID=1859473 RepID=UPI001E5CA61B|nr:hypothetical protein [Floricoccus tropicus]